MNIRVCPKCLGHRSVAAEHAHIGQQIRTDGSCVCPVCEGEGVIQETLTRSDDKEPLAYVDVRAACPKCGWSGRGD